MRDNIVVKGGSKYTGNAEVLDHAVLELHATVQGNALVRDHARVSRSIIEGDAVLAGNSRALDAYVGGTASLTVEFIGRNGHVEDPAHYFFIKIMGIGYTVHRTYSDAKGFGSQITRDDGKKLTMNAIRTLIENNPDHKVLLYMQNMTKKSFAGEET